MSDLAIRHATLADAATWAQMRTLLWPEVTGQEHCEEIEAFFRGELEEPNAVLIAGGQGINALGFAELSLRTDIPGCEGKLTGYVEGLYIRDEARGTTLALAFLRAAQTWAREQGCIAFASDRADRILIDHRYKPASQAKT